MINLLTYMPEISQMYIHPAVSCTMKNFPYLPLPKFHDLDLNFRDTDDELGNSQEALIQYV